MRLIDHVGRPRLAQVVAMSRASPHQVGGHRRRPVAGWPVAAATASPVRGGCTHGNRLSEVNYFKYESTFLICHQAISCIAKTISSLVDQTFQVNFCPNTHSFHVPLSLAQTL